jgi:hypothetical protein
MVASAFVLMASSAPKNSAAPDDNSAKSVVNGAERKITYTIYGIGDSYLKPTDYTKMGRSDHTQIGVNSWYIPRQVNYNDTIIHGTWPCVVAYNGYSGALASQTKYKYLTASWTTHMFYQLKVDAENITDLGTGPGMDPLIVPIFNTDADPLASDGGWVNASLLQNYLTDQEVSDIMDGLHYANTFYGVDAGTYWSTFHTLGSDGWWSEIQGHWDFSRRAAHKFLGLPGTALDIRTEYNAVGDAAIADQWRSEWIADGDTGELQDIYAAYDFSLFTGNGPVWITVKLDTFNSTDDKIALWFWSQTWGAEYLMIRYLEDVGIEQNLMPSREDWNLNLTLSPMNGDMHERMTTTYHMTAWKDTAAYNNPTWMLEPQHCDYTAERLTDLRMSQFDDYYWTYYGDTYRPLRLNYAPGQANYQKGVHYWQTPKNWNLAADETLIIKLPSATARGWGVEPYMSANFSVPGYAAAEMQSNGQSGEFVLGHGYPSTLYSATYYDAATKTITIPGGSTWAANPNPAYPSILESGSPLFMLDITQVSHYGLSIVEPAPYAKGINLTLRVTPKDVANADVRCNQTVELPAVAGVTYGASSHTFAWGEAYWDTIVNFSAPGSYTLASRDAYFYMDIVDSYAFSVGLRIPLYKGWNMISNPLVGVSYMASTLGLVKSDVVAGWNSATGVYDKNYIVGVSPPPMNFPIVSGMGYWVFVNVNESITLLGAAPTTQQTITVNVPATGGWAMIGLSTMKTTFKASNLAAMCTGGAIKTVASFNNALKTYKSYIVGGPPPTDFAIVPGNGYWIYCTGPLVMTYAP